MENIRTINENIPKDILYAGATENITSSACEIKTEVKKTVNSEETIPTTSKIIIEAPNWEAIRTQRERVLTYLKIHGSITKDDAYQVFHMFDLPSYICQLRKLGYIIDSIPERDNKNRKRTRYKYRHGPKININITTEKETAKTQNTKSSIKES